MNEEVLWRVLVDIGRGERTHDDDRSNTCNWNTIENGQLVFMYVEVLVDQPNTEDILKLILLEEVTEFLPHKRKRLGMFVGKFKGRKSVVGCKYLKES